MLLLFLLQKLTSKGEKNQDARNNFHYYCEKFKFEIISEFKFLELQQIRKASDLFKNI